MNAPATFSEALGRIGRCDKLTDHSYGPFYDRLLEPWRLLPQAERRYILAIGVSMLGGGDVLALAECCPCARIVALDIEAGALGHDVLLHPRVWMVWADAYERATWRDLAGRNFDLVIDDCVHDPDRQLELFALVWPKVKLGGRYVIEDVVPARAQALAQNVRDLLPADIPVSVQVLDLSRERPRCPDNCLILVERHEAQG